MWTKNGRLKCDSCGKFISPNKSSWWSYTFFSHSYETEPREPMHEHDSCYNKRSENDKKALQNACYIKPYLHKPQIIIS